MATAAGILKRRQGAGLVRTGKHRDFETWCTEQLDRIQRSTARQVRRVRASRRERTAATLKRVGEELAITVRGRCGSDVHADDDDDVTPLV